MLRRLLCLAVVMAALASVPFAEVKEFYYTFSDLDPNSPAGDAVTFMIRADNPPVSLVTGPAMDSCFTIYRSDWQDGELGNLLPLAPTQPTSCSAQTTCTGNYYQITLALPGDNGIGPAETLAFNVADGGVAGTGVCTHQVWGRPLPSQWGWWFGAVADQGARNAYPNAALVQAQMGQNLAALPASLPRFYLFAGDLTYGDDKGADDVTQHFTDSMQWSLDAAYMPVWGNHEWNDADAYASLAEWRARFELPHPQTATGSPSGGAEGPAGKDWSWFDYGGLRFISYPEPYSGAWTAWAADANTIMAAAQADANIKMIVTFGHRPPYSWGTDHGGDTSIRAKLQALALGYDKYLLNISGHSHHYERDNDPNTAVTHIVTGGGGATLGGVDPNAPAYTEYITEHLETVRCQALSDQVACYAICGPPGSGADNACTQGTIIDQFVIPYPGETPNAAPVGYIDDPNTVAIVAGDSVTLESTTNDAEDGSPCVGCTYLWDFPDDSGVTDSTDADPDPNTTIFEIPGTFTVTFTATDPNGLADPTPDMKIIEVAEPALSPPTTWYVRTDGNDSPCNGRTDAAGSGSLASCAYKTIGKAISSAIAGDTIHLGGGTHGAPGGLVITKSGNAIDGPITIEGDPNAVVRIQSGVSFPAGSGAWEDAPDPAPAGEWRLVDPNATSPSAAYTSAYIENVANFEATDVGLVLYKNNDSSSTENAAGLRHFRLADPNAPVYTSDSAICAIYVGPGVRQFTTGSGGDNSLHIRLKKTQELVDYEADYSTVLASDDVDPNTLTIRISQAPYTIKISGAYWVFKDLTILEAAKDTVLVTGASHLTFDNVTIVSGTQSAISAGSGSANDVEIVRSTLRGQNNPWVGWMDTHGDGGGTQSDADGKLGYACTTAEYQRGTMINLNGSSARWDIGYNLIRQGFDGVGVNATETDVQVHHNRIENMGDDPLEIEGSLVGRVQVFENYIANSLVCWAAGQTSDLHGPVLFYRNVCFLAREPFINRDLNVCRTWIGNPCQKYGHEYAMKWSGGGKNSYVYNNTVFMSSSNVPNTSTSNGLNVVPGEADPTRCGRERVFNNIFMIGSGALQKNWPTSATDFVFDRNLWYRFNSADARPLFKSYATFAAFQAGTPYEEEGRYADPQLWGFLEGMAWDSFHPEKWYVQPESQFKGPADFFPRSSSPARQNGFARCTVAGCDETAPWLFTDAEGVVSVLPDSRTTSEDIGAIPYDTPWSDWMKFPFNAGWVPPCVTDCPRDREGGTGIPRYYIPE